MYGVELILTLMVAVAVVATAARALRVPYPILLVVGGLLVAVTPDLTSKIKAGDIIKNIAPIVGGTGGGRPDLAQAGGRDASKLDEALAKVASLVQ